MKKAFTIFTLLVAAVIFFSFKSFHAGGTEGGDKLNLNDSIAIRKNVLEQVDKIFQAFVLRDTIAIRNLHSNDWVGMLQFSNLKRGIEGYMQAFRPLPPPLIGYHVDDYEVKIYSNVVAVYYQATLRNRIQGNNLESKLKSLDLYQKRNGNWIQVGSHTASGITIRQFTLMQQQNNEIKK